MKVFYVLTLIALVALTSMAKADFREDMKALCKNCQKESKATDEDLQKFFKNEMKAELVNEPIKCHLKCMMEKLGTIKNGVFDDKAFVEGIKEAPVLKDHIDAVAKAAAACKAQKGTNDCDTAYKIAMCIKENKEAAGVPRVLGAI